MRAPIAPPPSEGTCEQPRRTSRATCWPCGRRRNAAAASGADADGAPEPAVCPYMGLASFAAAQADLFFGRERLVAELVARLVGSPLLAVIGPSGSGKSSAVRAGLLPALAAGVLPGSERWRQVLHAARPSTR